MNDVPPTASEYWDDICLMVADGDGKWVLIAEDQERARNELVRERLGLRGLSVDVVSRKGNPERGRDWSGWRTWARVL